MQETGKERWSKHGGLSVENPSNFQSERMAREPPLAQAGRTRGRDTKFHVEFVELEVPIVEMPSRRLGIQVRIPQGFLQGRQQLSPWGWEYKEGHHSSRLETAQMVHKALVKQIMAQRITEYHAALKMIFILYFIYVVITLINFQMLNLPYIY